MEDWALRRHLHRSEGLSQRAIARQLGIARDTVAAAVATDGPPKYERASAPSAINEIEPRIRALLSAYPQMPATVIAERVGWTGSISWFRERKPFDPESKGIVERANRYLETSFLPGRSFDSPLNFNHQLAQWLLIANARRVRVLDGRPIDFLESERAQMLALPPVPPIVDTVTSVRLGRDYYVRVAGNDYSVDPTAHNSLPATDERGCRYCPAPASTPCWSDS